MEVSAVAPLRIAGVKGISPAPPNAALVIPHHAGHLVVDRPCLFFFGPQSLRCAGSQLPDWAIQGHEWFWRQLNPPILGAQRRSVTGVLPAGCLDDQRDLERRLGSIGMNMKRLVAEAGLTTESDRGRCVDQDLMNSLIQVRLRQRHPGIEGLRITGNVPNRRLVGQLKGSRFEIWLGPEASPRSEKY